MNESLVRILGDVRIDWGGTPQSVLGGCGEIRSPEDYERLQRKAEEAVGTGFFYIHVQNMSATLALMYSTRPGYWETELVPDEISPLSSEDLHRAVQAAGGAINWSGAYPLDQRCIEKLREELARG